MLKETAQTFGHALDNDDFSTAKTLLTEDCQYQIGAETLIGPAEICNSYEQNMIAGRKKMDELKWGQARIEPLGDNTFYVHFTDYLTHKGQKYTHRCKQELTINTEGKICRIVHVDEPEEQERLNAFYHSVGIKT